MCVWLAILLLGTREAPAYRSEHYDVYGDADLARTVGDHLDRAYQVYGVLLLGEDFGLSKGLRRGAGMA
ncbi:MAG: hypothetical protein HYY16_05860 [Planctomycetes bacterium]|nr:hypothetical protein [Planctomycetota bacterium]